MSDSYKTNAALAAGYTLDQVRDHARRMYDTAIEAGYDAKTVNDELFNQYGFRFDDFEQGPEKSADLLTNTFGMPSQEEQQNIAEQMELQRIDQAIAKQAEEEQTAPKTEQQMVKEMFSQEAERIKQQRQDAKDLAIQRALAGSDTVTTAMQRMPQEPKDEEVDSALDAWRHGFQHSVTGLAFNKPTLRMKEDASFTQRAVSQFGTMIGDIPTIVVGGVGGGIAGSGAPIVGTATGAIAGASALTEATRTALMQHYERGAITSVQELVDRSSDQVMAGMKGAAIALPAVKAFTASRTALLNTKIFGQQINKGAAFFGAAVTEAATAAGMQGAFEQRIPTMQDFALNGISMLGFKLGGFYTAKFRNIYADLNLTPRSTLLLAAKDRSIAEDLLSKNITIPRNLGNDHVVSLYAIRRNTAISGAKDDTLGWMHTSKNLATQLATTTNKKNNITDSASDNAFGVQDYYIAANARRIEFKTETMRTEAVKQFFEATRAKEETPPSMTKEEVQTLWDFPTKEFVEWLRDGSFVPPGKNSKPVGPQDILVNGSKMLILNDKVILDKEIVRMGQRPIEESIEDVAKNISVAETEPSSFKAKVRATYQMMFDRIQNLNEDAAIGKQTVPYMMARLYAGADGIAMHWMQFGRTLFHNVSAHGKGFETGTKGREVSGMGFNEILDMARNAEIKIAPETQALLEPILQRIKNDSLTEFNSLIDGGTGVKRSVRQELSSIRDADLAQMKEKYGEGSLAYKLIKQSIDKKYEGLITDAKAASEATWAKASSKDPLYAFRVFIAAKHAKDLIASNIETGLDAASVRAIADHPGLNKMFGAAHKELIAFQQALLDYKQKSGLISSKRREQLKTEYPNYVPFQRVMEDGGSVYASGNMRMHGSERAIIDPLESIVRATFTTIRQAEKNQAMRLIAEQYGLKSSSVNDLVTGPLAEWRQVLAESNNTFDNLTIEYLKNGKPVHVQVPKQIYDAAVQLDPVTSHMFANAFARGAAKVASVLRAGSILHPDFITKNPIRDQLAAYVNSDSGYIPIVDIGKGIGTLISAKTGGKLFPKLDGIYQEWLRHGGALSSYVAQDRVFTAEMIRTLHKTTNPHNSVPFTQYGIQSVLHAINPINVAKTAVRGLRTATEVFDEGTRLGEYARSRELGRSPYESAFKSRDVTIDFQRVGASMKGLNALSAFVNAHVQGADKQVRQIISDPVGTTARIIGGIVVPTILFSMVQQETIRRDPDSYVAKVLTDLPNWQKTAFWLLPGSDTVFKIAKPFEYAPLVTGPIEAFFEYLYSQDPDTPYLELLMDNGTIGAAADALFLNPGSWASYALPTAIRPGWEVLSNYNHFTGSPIQSAQAEKLLPPARYSPNTTQLAKKMSEVLYNITGFENTLAQRFISPVGIEHLVQGWSGSLGIEALRLVSKGLEKAGALEERVRPDRGIADLPIIRVFTVKYPSAGSKNVEKFFNNMEVFEQRRATIQDQLKEGSATSKAIAERVLMDGNFARFTKMRESMSTIAKAIRGMHYDDRYTDVEKAERIDNMYMQMIQIAKQGNAIMKEIKRQTKQRHKEIENANARP